MKKQNEMISTRTLTMSSGSTYTISSIINHNGNSPDEGHYNVLIYDQLKNSFVLLDDLDISHDVDVISDMNCMSYLLFYTKDE